jgi:hypothetical protein
VSGGCHWRKRAEAPLRFPKISTTETAARSYLRDPTVLANDDGPEHRRCASRANFDMRDRATVGHLVSGSTGI